MSAWRSREDSFDQTPLLGVWCETTLNREGLGQTSFKDSHVDCVHFKWYLVDF